MEIQQAVLVLANHYKSLSSSKFPKKKTSYLFGNQYDIASWLAVIPSSTKEVAYKQWVSSRHHDPNRIRNSIIINNLPHTVTNADLLLIAGTIGVPRDIYRPRIRSTEELGKFAFIDFETPIDILTALKELHGCVLYTNTICIDVPSSSFTVNPSSIKKRKETEGTA